MAIVFDILHLAVAAVLAIIGVDYEREQDCPPVYFQPAAHVQPAQAAAIEGDTPAASLIYASECEGDGRAVRLPAL